MTGDVLAPVVERHAPRVRAVVGAEADQPLRARLEAKPAAVLLPHRTVGRFDLRVMKDRLAKDQIAVGRPGEIVQRVMRVLGAEARQHDAMHVRLVVAVGVLQEREVRLLGDIHAAVTELERQRDVQVVGEHGRFVGPAVAVGVFENDQLVVRLVAGIDVRIRRRATDPQPAARIPTHLNRIGDVGKLFFAGEQVHLESRIDLERLEFIGRAHPFVGAAALQSQRQRRDVGVNRFGSNLLALRDIPDVPIAVGDHDVEVAHRRQKIEIAVRLVPSAGVIKRVDRPEAAEELFVFVDDRREQRFFHRGRLDPEHQSEQRLRKEPIAVAVEMHAVDRQIGAGAEHFFLRRLEDIGESDLLFLRRPRASRRRTS